MSLLHDDPPAATAVGRSGLMVKQFEDGAIGLIDTVTKQAMHLPPDRALQLRQALAATAAAPDSTAKPTNPKDAVGSDKLPLHLWPTTATALGCLGLLDGALKYGRSNWRVMGVRASIYYDAARRHLDAWFEGEECDPDSRLHHLAHALACIAILVDAEAVGKLHDDRMVNGTGYRGHVRDLTSEVPRLRAAHAGKAPKHYTIADDGDLAQ